ITSHSLFFKCRLRCDRQYHPWRYVAERSFSPNFAAKLYMTDQLIVGELVVAKGKLATIQQILSAKSIRVVVKATGEALMVSQRDIERIVGLTGGVAGGNVIHLNVNDYGEDEFSLAVERYNVISQWRVKEVTTAQACVKLNLSRSYFFRLAKMCDEEIGPLSLVLQRRGVKKGVTRLDEAVEVI